MVKYVRLVTGEEIIAKVEEADKVKLTTPVRIVITAEGVGMGPVSPFMSGSTKTIEVAKEHVVFIAEPDDEIKNAYNAQFGSGIITAPAGAIPPTAGGIDIVRD
jgi:hypothetical protein